MSQDLARLRVWITRPAEAALASCEAWMARGARCTSVPLVERTPVAVPADTARELADLSAQSPVLLFTSAAAVEFWRAGLQSHPNLAASLGRADCAVVGDTTAAAAERLGHVVRFRSPLATAHALGQNLPVELMSRPLVWPTSEQAGSGLTTGLADRPSADPVAVCKVVVYQTLSVDALPALATTALADRQVDLVALYSPSAVAAWRTLGDANIPVAVLGPATRHAALSAGLSVVAEANPPSEPALLQAVARWHAA